MIKQTHLSEGVLRPSATFCSGEGISKHYINCEADPYDLRPIADFILKAANTLLIEASPEKPLVILVGEEHTLPAPKALLQLLATRFLQNRQEFTVNFEDSHNAWSHIALIAMGKSVPRGLFYNCAEFDQKGLGVLSSQIGFQLYDYAPYSQNSLMSFCYENKITTLFNDAARWKRSYLDLSDPHIKEVAAQKKITEKKINIASDKGIDIRNIFMAERGVKAAKENKVKLILQHCGLQHIFGDSSLLASSRMPLCKTYQQAGAIVLPVFISTKFDNFGVNRVPPEFYDELSKSIIVDGLPEKKFRKSFLSRLWGAEKREYKKLCGHSGHEIEFHDISEKRETYRNLARGHADDILAAYEATKLPSHASNRNH
ncbi:MAG: hypothetical protein CO093_11235 [Alphaproteobacteria bacterium CG_4_9_14_3_um_filter_47_13]|nr:MAG: hypothetical protein CO093_11235 [Alphaproteobacteria bacterium CG_4_9_14_3_um_filter_47_13]